MPMPSAKWFTASVKNRGIVAIYLLLLALSILYLAGAFYLNSNRHSGSYAVKFAFKTIDVFINRNFQMLLIILLVMSAFMIFFVPSLHLRIAIIVILFGLISGIVLGILIGGLAGFFPVESIYLEEQSYHLSHFYDGSDTAYYEMFQCDSLGVTCQHIGTYGGEYSSFRPAKLELDEEAKQISVIVDGQLVDTISLR
jgi:hypothetical protein